jgi:uncharacterized protein (TIGR02145 family)
MKYFLSICSVAVLISYGIVACEDPEVNDPADLRYELSAPTLQTVNAVTDVSIALTWQDNEEHTTEFVISRQDTTGTYSQLAEVDKAVLSYTDTTCELGVTYSYVIQSKVETNLSDRSNVLQEATSFNPPSNLNGTSLSNESLYLTWTDNTTFEEGYRVERDSGAGFIEIGMVSADVTEFIDTGLTYSMSYSYRVAAYTSANASAYCISVTKMAIAPVVDYDGNVYQTILIGNQVWMTENLKVSHYRNGITIPNIIDSLSWTNASSGASCSYDNDEANVAIYGRLYNWYAVIDSHSIAPEGWHVPSNQEWSDLANYLGGGSIAGGVMKEAGEAHWKSPNIGATNNSGFTALPGGKRHSPAGYFFDQATMAYFWSSTPSGINGSWVRTIYSGGTALVGSASSYSNYGFSIRCLKD